MRALPPAARTGPSPSRRGTLGQDLPATALLLLAFLALNIAVTKIVALRLMKPALRRLALVRLLGHVMAQDVVALALAALLVLVARRLTAPPRARLPVLAALWTALALLTAAHVLSVGFFFYFGVPLNVELALLTPAMAGYASNVVTREAVPLVLLALLSILTPLALGPRLMPAWRHLLVRSPRAWRWPAWSSCLAAGAAGLVLMAVPPRDPAARRLMLLSLVVPARWQRALAARPPSAQEQRTLEAILGPPDTATVAAFHGLARRRRNILVWVWESVGARHLRSESGLGWIRTPNFDRLLAGGSVRFARAFAECPLSAQSDWAMMTGTSPPRDPSIFLGRQRLPPHPPLLPQVLRTAGYRTAFISTSQLRSWGEWRFLDTGAFDLLVDAAGLTRDKPYGRSRWTIEARALAEGFSGWLDGIPPGQPFFAVLWNLETHVPYTWVGMTPGQEGLDAHTRYRLAVERSDGLLGAICADLERRGLLADTLVVVVGDHGEGMMRSHADDRVHSQLVFEDDVNVPLAFINPGLAGERDPIQAAVTHVDLYPTLLDLVGLPPPPGLEGVSLAGPVPPRVLVSRSVQWWPVSARAGRFKLTVQAPALLEGWERPALYDLADDPWEATDIAPRRPDVAQALHAYLNWSTAGRARFEPGPP